MARVPSPTSWSTTAVFHPLSLSHMPPLISACIPNFSPVQAPSVVFWAVLCTGPSNSLCLNRGAKGIFH